MAAMRESVAPGGRSVRFRESSVSPLARGSTLKRGTAAEDLRQGSMRASMAMSAAMRQLQDTTDSTSKRAAAAVQDGSCREGGTCEAAQPACDLPCRFPTAAWPALCICAPLPPAVVMGANSEEVDALQQQNVALKEALDGARQELFEVYKQVGAPRGVGVRGAYTRRGCCTMARCFIDTSEGSRGD